MSIQDAAPATDVYLARHVATMHDNGEQVQLILDGDQVWTVESYDFAPPVVAAEYCRYRFNVTRPATGEQGCTPWLISDAFLMVVAK